MIAPTWTYFHPCRFIKHDTDLRLYKGYFSNKGYHKGIAKYYRLLTYGYMQSEISIDRRITSKENIKTSFAHLKNFITTYEPTAKIKFLTGTNQFKSNPKNKL